TISLLPILDFTTVYRFSKIENPEINAKIEKRLALIASCPLPEVKAILAKANAIAKEAFLTNVGAWAIYVVPIAIVCFFLGKIVGLLRKLISLPANEIEREFSYELELATG